MGEGLRISHVSNSNCLLPSTQQKTAFNNARFCTGGGGEIRTRDRVTPVTVFKTVSLDHSDTPPLLEHNYIKKALFQVQCSEWLLN